MVTTAVDGLGCKARLRMFAHLAKKVTRGWLIQLVQRLGIAAVFFQSGRTKVQGIFTITDSTFYLFQTDYRLPFIAPVPAAYIAAASEHVFPILLVLGLFTRISALALFIMTMTIEVFVYPDAWPTHLSWAAILIPLIGRGGGRLSLDRLFGFQ